MSPFYDKSLKPLLPSENAGPSQSDTPLQPLWRSDSSTPECPENEHKERHHKQFSVGQKVRRMFFVGALTLGFGLLVLWLFLLLMDDTPIKMLQNVSPPTSTPPLLINEMTMPQKSNEGERITTTKTKKEKTRKAQKQQRERQRHHQMIRITAAPITNRTTPGKESQETGTGKTAVTVPQPPTMAIYVMDGTMELSSKWGRGEGGRETPQIVVAKMGRVGETGIAAKLTTETLMSAEKKTPSMITPIWTTKTPETARQWINSEEDDNMVFFRPGYSGKHSHSRPTGLFKNRLLTTASPPLSAEKNSQRKDDDYDAIRPTIQFGPMDALEMVGGQHHDKKEQHREELNEIIASLEKENGVNPVEIPFPADSPSIPIPEPVWRRPPPNETALPILPPKTPLSSVGVKAPTYTQKRYEQPLHAKAIMVERKRREAPVMVTALLNIGRGDWPRFTRHFDQYLDYLAKIVLRLQNRFIIYCDSPVTSHLLSLGDRINWERIQVVEMSLQELPYYKFRDEIEGIMRWEQSHWNSEWDAQMRTHPETTYAVYDILVNSKPYFLLNATLISRFAKPMKGGQQFFVWLDAGYGHGSVSEIPHGVWSPVLKADKITLVQLTPKIDRVERYTLDKVYRRQKSVVSGGFLAGSAEAIRRFHTFFHKSFIEMLDEKMVDDDQTTLLVTIQKYQSDFHIVFGGWFDAFKLLPSKAMTNSQD